MTELNDYQISIIGRYRQLLQDNNLSEFFKELRAHEYDHDTNAILDYMYEHVPNLFSYFTEIPVSCFENVITLGNDYFTSFSVPNGISSIENYAFQGCSHLTKVELPDSITIIGRRAFAGTALEEINLPDGLQFTDDRAFEKTKLTTLVIPKSVVSTGAEIFSRTTSLKQVQIPKYLAQGWIVDIREEVRNSGFSAMADSLSDHELLNLAGSTNNNNATEYIIY